MSKQTYRHAVTGKVQELDDAVAALFPAFLPVEDVDQPQSEPVVEVVVENGAPVDESIQSASGRHSRK
ncbi:hypothetical protein [Pseudolysinimonas sp.]|uniref:hypothetical protein n=1 Tax=Pseudolysinimonas sp. TaxID=2680009 RepID=UPI003F806AFC